MSRFEYEPHSQEFLVTRRAEEKRGLDIKRVFRSKLGQTALAGIGAATLLTGLHFALKPEDYRYTEQVEDHRELAELIRIGDELRTGKIGDGVLTGEEIRIASFNELQSQSKTTEVILPLAEE